VKPNLKLTAAALVGAAALVALGILALSHRHSSEEARVPSAGASPEPVAELAPVRPPRPLPVLKLTDEDGRPSSLTRLKGKVVLVNFWATWCAPCVEELPALSRLQARLSGGDFTVVAVAVDRNGPEAVKPFLKDHGIANLTVLYDPTMAASRAVGVTGLPTSVLVDRQGREIARAVGTPDWDKAQAMRPIEEALGTRKPPSS
jgi:thiol-disulfide isomerase/thioredoxin